MAKRPGKYDHITPHLPRLPGVDAEYRDNPKYQERVEQTKREILMERAADESDATDADLAMNFLLGAEENLKVVHRHLLRRCAGQAHATTLAAAYAACRDLKDRINGWLSNTNLLIEAYAQLMADRMENEGVSAVDLNGRPVRVRLEPYTTVKDRAANLAWASRECEHCMAKESEHTKMVDGLRTGTHEEPDPVTGQTIRAEHFFKPNDLRQSLQLPWGTLDSLVRRMLLDGEELPPGVEAFAKTKITLGGGD